MADEPLDGFADRVQYPLASPSKRCPRKEILIGFVGFAA